MRRPTRSLLLLAYLLSSASVAPAQQQEFLVEKEGKTLAVSGELDVKPFLDYLNGRKWESADGDTSKTLAISGVNWSDPSTQAAFLEAVRTRFGGEVTFADAYRGTQGLEGYWNAVLARLGVPTAKNALTKAQGEYDYLVTWSGGFDVAAANIRNGSLKVSKEIHFHGPILPSIDGLSQYTKATIYIHRGTRDWLNFLEFGSWKGAFGEPVFSFKITLFGNNRLTWPRGHDQDEATRIIKGTSGGQASGTAGGAVGGAGGGGVESRPPWLGRGGPDDSKMSPRPAQAVPPNPMAALEELIPRQGPRGEIGRSVTPKDVLAISNAVRAAGVDYVDAGTGKTVASIFAAETLNSIYEHDYVVCSRVQNYELRAVSAFQYKMHWWWMLRAAKPSLGQDELVIPLTIALSGSRAAADSRYLVEYYPSPISGTVLSYQIRASSLTDALFLLDALLALATQRYQLSYANITEPPAPTVFARTAEYRNPRIELTVENIGPLRTVRFFGPTWAEPRRTSEKFVDFTVKVPTGRSEVRLPVGPIHDAVIYIKAGDFLDKVYVAGGYWFAWDDSAGGGTSQVSMKTSELQHGPVSGADDSFVSPPLAEISGVVTSAISWSHVGMGYAFRQGREPADFSRSQGVAFWAKGDGKRYRVKLESAAVRDNDYHGAYFTASAQWQLITVSFSELKQEGWGKVVPWSGTDIHTVSFVTVDRPLPSVYLAIDRLSFLRSAQPSGPRISALVNAASFVPSSAAPGEIITVFGTDLGPVAPAGARLDASGYVDRTLSGVRVLFDGLPAPLLYVSAGQISAVVPYGVVGKTATQLQIEFSGRKSEVLALPVADATPGIFTVGATGKGQGAILNQDGTLNSAANPAGKGSIVVLYATGEGQTSPPGVDGKPAVDVLPKPLLPVSVRIGGVEAEVRYAGAAPGYVAGLMQVNVHIPGSVAPGDAVSVLLSVGAATTQAGVTLAVR